MIKIAVFGHSPDAFSDAKSLMRDIDNTIAIIKRQHGSERDFTFLLNGEPGASQWFCNALMEQDIPYELFLSAPPSEASKFWSDEQQERFMWQINKAKAIHVFDLELSLASCINRNKRMIESCQWVLMFWNGKHQGLTYTAMKFALENNKIVYNGIGELTLVNGNALKVEKDERL